MKHMVTASYAKPLASYLIAALIAVTAFAAPAEAMLLPAGPGTAPPVDRAADLALIQRTMESQVLQQHLMDYGLTPEQALQRLSSLPDEQVHQFASRIDALQAGGRRAVVDLEVLLLILLIVLLILIIVQDSPADHVLLA
jgi:hypothetical protein